MSESQHKLSSLLAHLNARRLIAPIAIAMGAWAMNHYREQGSFAWIPEWCFDGALVIAFLLLIYWVWTQEDVREWRRLLYNWRPKMLLALLIVVGALLGGFVGAFGYWTIERQQRQEIKPAPDQTKQDTNITQSNAVEGLSKLGWTVRPESDGIQFEIMSKPLPPMKESAAYFRQLQKPFRLHFQGIRDIEGLHELAGIVGCTKIEINAGEFTDLTELRGFSSLNSLIISQTPINGLATVDLSSLSELVSLRDLNLSSTKATSVEPIAKLTELRTLNLRDVPIRDLSPLVDLHKLESIDVTGTGATSLSALKNAKDLNELGVGGKQVADLATLNDLGKLKSLRIIEQETFDWSPIGELPNLEHLFVWATPLFNLSPLRKLTKLQSVHLSGLGFVQPSLVIDVNALGDLKDLKKLTLGELQIDDLSFVSSLKNLVEINIGRMPVSSVAPLCGLTSLKSVSLNTTSVVDISPLLDLPALSNLSVIHTPARVDVLSELERRGVSVQR